MGGVSLLILLLLPTPGYTADSLWDGRPERAEEEFRRGATLLSDPHQKAAARACFAKAAQLYNQLLELGYQNAALYCNLGNAYLLTDDLPHAILAYRHGLRLKPNDLELRRNLGYARQQVTFKPQNTLGRPPVEHRPPWLPRLPEITPWLAFVLYGVGWLAGARWWMTHRSGWLTTAGASFAGASVLVLLLAWEGWADHQETVRPLVVIARDDVLLRRGNGEAYPARYQTPINRGVEARRLYERGDWLQIELAGGEVGWVKRSDVLEDR